MASKLIELVRVAFLHDFLSRCSFRTPNAVAHLSCSSKLPSKSHAVSFEAPTTVKQSIWSLESRGSIGGLAAVLLLLGFYYSWRACLLPFSELLRERTDTCLGQGEDHERYSRLD